MAPLALALVASLAMHVAALGLFADAAKAKRPGAQEAGAKPGGKKGPKPGERSGGQEGSLDVVAMRARLVQAPAAPAEPGKGKGASSAKDCPAGAYYAGVGIAFSANGVIEMVAPGGPADKADVRAGDLVAGAEPALLGPDKYRVGQPMTIVVARGAERLVKTMQVAEICYETARRP